MNELSVPAQGLSHAFYHSRLRGNDKKCMSSIMFYLAILLCLIFISLPTFANEKLIVILDWFPNPNHAPLFVTKEMGFFKAAGLDVELIGPANPSDPPKLAAARKADIA